MSLQSDLSVSFTNAIELEQKCDLLLTDRYLSSFSPKKLANFGLAIVNLLVSNVKNGMGGKMSIELSPDPAFIQPGDEMNIDSLKVGDIVKLGRLGDSDETSVEGILTRLNGNYLQVSVSETMFDNHAMSFLNNTGHDNHRMWIVKLTNSITYKRMLQAMVKLKELREHEKSQVIEILIGEHRFAPKNLEHKKVQYWDNSLNPSQREAIEFSMFKSPISIIHGPPGTGKTHTLIELIKQLVFTQGEKLLVCGASNVSVDNILERLSPSFSPLSESSSQKKTKRKDKSKAKASPEKLIRIGHPARLLPANLKHSLDILSKMGSPSSGSDQSVLKDIGEDIKRTISSIAKCKRFSERKTLWGELKQLRRELKHREIKISHDLIVNANVVLSTLHGAGSNELFNIYKTKEFSAESPLFDTIIIDEVSQSIEPQCWIPLMNHVGCRRLVIAGDNQQLPPTIESIKEASIKIKEGEIVADLSKTLFDRLISDQNGSEFKKLLNIQYRMNEKIMEFPSHRFYEGNLVAGETVRSHLLSDISGVEATEETTVPCIWYDTQGGDFPERMEEEESCFKSIASAGSKFNDSEIMIVIDHIKKLASAGVQLDHIGVISPYSAQVSKIRKQFARLYESLIEVSTIDGFQGREKEAIIVSLVRSNDSRDVGFLSDFRRLNVAMTRPKRHLCVIGDMELLERSSVQFLVDWTRYANENFEIRYPNLADLL